MGASDLQQHYKNKHFIITSTLTGLAPNVLHINHNAHKCVFCGFSTPKIVDHYSAQHGLHVLLCETPHAASQQQQQVQPRPQAAAMHHASALDVCPLCGFKTPALAKHMADLHS